VNTAETPVGFATTADESPLPVSESITLSITDCSAPNASSKSIIASICPCVREDAGITVDTVPVSSVVSDVGVVTGAGVGTTATGVTGVEGDPPPEEGAAGAGVVTAPPPPPDAVARPAHVVDSGVIVIVVSALAENTREEASSVHRLCVIAELLSSVLNTLLSVELAAKNESACIVKLKLVAFTVKVSTTESVPDTFILTPPTEIIVFSAVIATSLNAAEATTGTATTQTKRNRNM